MKKLVKKQLVQLQSVSLTKAQQKQVKGGEDGIVIEELIAL